MGHFWPYWIRIPNPDTDPLTWLNPDPTRGTLAAHVKCLATLYVSLLTFFLHSGGGGGGRIKWARDKLWTGSVVDPHWFQCGSGSREPNQCGFMTIRIQILVRLYSCKKWKFLHEKYNEIGIRSKNIRTKVKYPIFKTGNQFYFKTLVYFHVPGSGSAFPISFRIQDVKWMRIHADPDPPHYGREYIT